MTTRVKGFTVILDNEMREDDIEYIVNAMRMIKGVQQVLPVESCSEDMMARQKCISDIKHKLFDIVNEL